MGNYKKRHAQDKLYITQSQWAKWGGGYRKADKADFKRLPFDCCALSLRPATNPYMTRQGHLFDFVNIIPWVKKYGTNPITGEKLSQDQLIKVIFHKNTDQKFHCPVLYELFNEQSHIVAIATTGHVYSMRAVKELCLSTKSFRDLITEKPFKKEDIIDIQNPLHLEKFNFTAFDYLRKGIDVSKIVKNQNEDLANGSKRTTSALKSVSQEVGATLKELYENDKEDEIIKSLSIAYHDKQLAPGTLHDAKAHYSTGMVGQSFTSTAISRHTVNHIAQRDDKELRNSFIKKKGYCQIRTTLGNLNFELHCDMTPLACENFITHSKNGYYDKTVFHRLIKDFMVQGGDPTGTGKGGESIYGKPFKDEYRQSLHPNKRGILAMANRGPMTNGSQFFILFSDQDHLYRKHTVFGKLVGGQDTLNNIENVDVNEMTDRPIKPIHIIGIDIFVDPFEDANDKIAKIRLTEKAELEKKLALEKEKREKNQKRLDALERAKQRGVSVEELKILEKQEYEENRPKGVGRYLKKVATTPVRITMKKPSNIVPARPVETVKKLLATQRAKKKSSFGDFSSW